MTTYTVHHPAASSSAILRDIDHLHLVKEGFCWPAFFMPVIWFAFRRLWLALAGYLLVVSGVLVIIAQLDVSAGAAGSIGLAVNLFAGFEANNLRRLALHHRAYEEIGIVAGSSLFDAERRVFAAALNEAGHVMPAIRPAPPPASTAKQVTSATAHGGPVGLFPAPGGPA
jgi:hypothetical protein